MRRIGLWLMVGAILTLGGCAMFSDGIRRFERGLAGSNQVPPILTGASGTVEVTLDGNELVLEGSFQGLEGELREVAGASAHVHQGAAGATGDIVFALDVEAGADDRSGTFDHTEALSEAQKSDFEDGLYYLNIHSSVHPGGELRAQLHQQEPQEPGSLVQVGGQVSELVILFGLLQDAGVLDDLDPEGDYTILAPHNAAVSEASDDLPSDEASREAVFQYHVLPGTISYDDIAASEGGLTTMLPGATIPVATDSQGVLLAGHARIAKRNILASNGLIHVVDAVLIPPDGEEASE